MRAIGVLTGGFSENDLKAAGAATVYRDIAHMLVEYSEYPVEQTTRVPADVAIATANQVSIKRDAREAVNVRAIDDDLVLGSDAGVELVGGIEMERARDVLRVICPTAEGHDELEIVAVVELRP